MQVFNAITEKTVEIDDKTTVYVQRRNLENKFPYAEDFDKIKIVDAVKGETVRTFLYTDGYKIPDIYKIL